MKIVFMGTPDFAVPCLQRLVQDGHMLAGVFTQPDKPSGRGMAQTQPPVKQLALQLGLPVYQPEKLRDGTAAELLRSLAPELGVVVAYGKILPEELLQTPPLGCMNVHASLLPKHRGAAPIQWSILNGDTVTGVTTMLMDKGMDTGDMLLKLETPIGPEETAGQLFGRLSQLGAEAMSQTIPLLAAGKAVRTPQDESQATYAPMLQKSMSELDMTKDAQTLYNAIRGLHPWPGAYVNFAGKRLKVHVARVVQGQGQPGSVLDMQAGILACGSGALQLLEVQPEGKAKMAMEQFLRGFRSGK